MPHPHPDSLRVVFETNLLISWLHFPGSALAKVWELLYSGCNILILSPMMVVEMAERLRTKFGWEESVLQRTLRAMVRKAIILRPLTIPDAVPADPDDNHILACAIAGKALCANVGETASPESNMRQRIWPGIWPMPDILTNTSRWMALPRDSSSLTSAMRSETVSRSNPKALIRAWTL